MVLILGVLLGPECARAQSTETQQLSLEQGENFVSLRVQPEDASLSTIFQGHLDQIHRVKDEQGRVYMPGDGIEQFTTWDPDESYKVYTTGSFSVEVTGTPSSLTTATVPLEKGGNLIPFVPADPQAVDDALASVSRTLLRVEGEDDQIYEPEGTPSSLDSLRAGQGYVLYVNQPDTLRYTIQTATLMEALSLQGIETGQYIRARGRDEPGDGGGGMFAVMNSGDGLDGGTAYAFDEDRQQVTETITGGIAGGKLSNSDLSWGHVQIKYGTGPKDVVTPLHFHGQISNRNQYGRLIDLQAGEFTDTGWQWLDEVEEKLGWDRGGEYEVTYEYATSDRRLVRQGIGDSVQLEWWGPPQMDSNYNVVGAYIIWAMDKAKEIREAKSLNKAYVDIQNDYWIRDQVLLRDGVLLRGIGSLNDDGRTRSTLKVPPGQALYQWNTDYTDSDDRYDITKDPNRDRVHSSFRGRKQNFEILSGELASDGVSGFVDIQYDGNVFNNLEIFTDQYQHPNLSIERWLQDSGDYQGFYMITQSGDPNGHTVVMDDYHFRNGGGSGVGSAPQPDAKLNFDVDGLVIENTVRNHLLYTVPTETAVDDVTLRGEFWGASPLAQTAGPGNFKYTNLTFEELYTGEFFYNAIMGARPGGQVEVDGFTVDLESSSKAGFQIVLDVIVVDEMGSEFKNGTIRGYLPENYTGNQPSIIKYRDSGIGENTSLTETRLQNLTVIDNGLSMVLGANLFNLVINELDYQLASGVTDDGNPSFAALQVRDSDKDTEASHYVVYKDFTWEPAVSSTNGKGGAFVFGTNGPPSDPVDAHPLDVKFKNASVNNEHSYNSFLNEAGGTDASIINYAARLLWTDSEFRIQTEANTENTSQYWHNDLAGDSPAVRIRDCTDKITGRVSDNSGTYASDDNDEGNDYVIIDPSLLSNPNYRTATVTSGTPSVTGVQVVDENNNVISPVSGSDFQDAHKHKLRVNLDQPIGTGNTIDVGWTAKVTPPSQIKKTGLFRARKVISQDGTGGLEYTSGFGSATYDLRGTFASMESNEKIIYTASSGDTSIVTVSVQSDDYTLELTEQGTGTATITVTGEIPGVGTTQTTFEVTVE
jgi:hypothetical protein